MDGTLQLTVVFAAGCCVAVTLLAQPEEGCAELFQEEYRAMEILGLSRGKDPSNVHGTTKTEIRKLRETSTEPRSEIQPG